jgi:hypothetical protein
VRCKEDQRNPTYPLEYFGSNGKSKATQPLSSRPAFIVFSICSPTVPLVDNRDTCGSPGLKIVADK